MEGEIDLPVDLQCGDIFHLCALVSRGEVSLTPYLPEEGVGEAEDSRTSKRKSDASDDCGGDNIKRMRTSHPNDNEIITRREKGFPGIRISLSCVTLPRIHALEMFKGADSHDMKLPCQGDRDNSVDSTIDLSVTKMSSGFDECHPSKDIIDSRDTIQSTLADNKSPWDTMARYADYLSCSDSGGKIKYPFDPELFKIICSEIQNSGDQGLSMKEISEVLNLPGKHIFF